MRRTALTVAVVSDDGNLLTAGEGNFSRDFINSLVLGMASGGMRLGYFTARKAETTTQVRVITGGTAAAATPTLCRIGLYQIAANGDGALVAATANDTSLFAAGNTTYTRSWTASHAKAAGTRYAVGILVVSGAALPSFAGNLAPATAENAIDPRINGSINSITDLPASFLAATPVAGSGRVYTAILP